MKKGTLLVVRKPYQGDTVIQNTLNYAIGSLFADEEDILTSHIDNEDDSDQIIEEYYRLQAPYNMTDHRRMFHFILTTRTSKSMCTILEEGAYALQDYFSFPYNPVISKDFLIFPKHSQEYLPHQDLLL